MLLERGDAILVAHRRMFQQDESRYFLGQVIAIDHELLKLEGFTFAQDLGSGHVVRKDEMRVKLLSLASPGFLFYQLPDVEEISSLQIVTEAGEVILRDGKRQIMNLTERSHSGQF
jgi:hypothetical protein